MISKEVDVSSKLTFNLTNKEDEGAKTQGEDQLITTSTQQASI